MRSHLEDLSNDKNPESSDREFYKFTLEEYKREPHGQGLEKAFSVLKQVAKKDPYVSMQRNLLIRALSQELGLTREHHQMLSNRGLIDEQIKDGLFFSIGRWQKVSDRYPLNLPGVYRSPKGDLQLKGKGIAIVAIDADGLATGWQVMNDDPRPIDPAFDFTKYYWAKGDKSSHLPIGDGELPIQTIGTASNPDTIWACEGLLKPVVASYRIGDRFIGAAGGLFRSSPIQVKAALKNVQTVIIAVDAGAAAYMLGNGQGKVRMSKTLSNVKPKTWLLLFLSTGEVAMVEYLRQAKIPAKGGMEARMPSIPADVGKVCISPDWFGTSP